MRITGFLLITLLVSACAGMAFGLATPAAAQAYPSKPVRVVVPWPPGGSVDTNARQQSAQIATQSGWNIFVENRAGANGMIGAELVSKAAPDGYTLMFNSASLAINQVVYPDVKYNVLRDFVPISNSSTTSGSILAVNAAFAANSLKDFIALAKTRAQGGKALAYGSPGVGNGTHLTTELFAMRAGIQMLHVPYPGVPQMVTALLSGDIALIITPGTALQQFIKQGKIRALAVTGARRLPFVPDAPTLAELGVPGFPIPGSWTGWYAPAKTPRDIVMKVNGEIRKAVHAPKLMDILVATGNEIVASSPEEFARLIGSEIERYTEVVRVAKIKVE